MTERKTIYVVEAAIAFTGALKAAQNMARVLSPHAQMVMVLPTHSAILPTDMPEFHEILYLPLTNPGKSPAKLLAYLRDLLRTSLALRRQLSARACDTVILNDFYLLHGVVLRALGYRGTILQWVRCDPLHFGGKLAHLILETTLRSADHIIAVSQFVAGRLPNSTKMRVIYDTVALPPPRAQAALSEKILLYIGNYIAGKGQDVALEAFAQAYAHDPSLRLHYYGGDMGLEQNRAYRESLAVHAAALGVSAVVRVEGFTANLTPLYAQAYAAINCSFSESFSMTVLEASAAGLPVIATRCGGPEEIINHGTTGLLVPVGDVTAIRDAMLTLAGDSSLARAMGEAGATHVALKFNPNRFAAELIALCNLAQQ